MVMSMVMMMRLLQRWHLIRRGAKGELANIDEWPCTSGVL